MSVHAFPQRRAMTAYQQARLDAMHAAERASQHASCEQPEPYNFGTAEESSAEHRSLWLQICEEFKAAPAYEQIGLVCFFVFGVGMNAALFCGWLT